MQDLVFRSEKGNPITTSLLVAEKFGKKHKNVLQAINNLIQSAENSAHFFYRDVYRDSMNRTKEMFVMNRDGFSLLVMGFTGNEALKFKIDFINAFNKMEEVIRSKDLMPNFNNPAEAARAWADAYEKKQLAENKVKELMPKALFADSVSASKTSILIGELAKILRQNGIETGQNRLFQWMRENRYLISRNGTDFNMPTQKSMDLGLFEIKETTVNHSDGHITINKTPKVTGKGQKYFIDKLLISNQ